MTLDLNPFGECAEEIAILENKTGLAPVSTTNRLYAGRSSLNQVKAYRIVEYLSEHLGNELPDVYFDPVSDIAVSEGDRYSEEISSYLENSSDLDSRLIDTAYAVKAVLGDWDVNIHNIRVNSSGDIYPIDFEFAGTRELQEMWERLDSECRKLEDLGYEFDEERLRRSIQDIAQSVDLESLEESFEEDEHLEFSRGLNIIDTPSVSERVYKNIKKASEGEFGGFRHRINNKLKEKASELYC